MNDKVQAIKAKLLAEAASLGKSVEEHAAAELAKLNTRANQIIVAVGVIAFVLGAIVGHKL
jgi:hypothetical protein